MKLSDITSFVFPPWARVAIMVGLYLCGAYSGWWIKSSIDARHELKAAKAEIRGQDEVDKSTAEKLRSEAKADAQRGLAIHRDQENARKDPTYRQYRDTPLPPAALQLLRDAGQVDYGPDRAKPGLRTQDR